MNTINCMTMSAADCRALSNDRPVGVLACGRRVFGYALAATALMCAVPACAAVASADANLEQWLLRRLNEPTELERAHEREGNVYIYDGLTDHDVDHALNTQFNRIEHMMFLGTRKTGSTGSANGTVQDTVPGGGETESSGCQ